MNAFAVGGDFASTFKRRGDSFGGAKHEGGELRLGREAVVVVDMPGYGKASREEWGREIMKYLSGRRQMRRAFLLVDAEHGLKVQDEQLLEILRGEGVPHQVVLSKADKILFPTKGNPSVERMERHLGKLRELQEKIKSVVQPRYERGSIALGEILACSAEKVIERKRLGIDGVRWAVLQAAGLGCDGKGKKTAVDVDFLEMPKVLQRESEVVQEDLTSWKPAGHLR